MKRYIICFFILILVGELSSQVTYYQHVEPIIQKHCQNCHRDGDIGPMPLITYDEVASYASMIKFVTDTKLMPPFKANIHKVSYANERSISKKERELIAQWIEEELPVGSPNKRTVTSKDLIKEQYDYTVCMEEPFEHYGIYYDQYQVFPLPVDIPKGKYIKDVVFEPGNREIVRSANISIAPIGTSDQMDQWDPRYGFFAYGSLGFTAAFPNWYSWMPHTEGLQLSENEHLFLPTDSELLLHIHYGPYGQIETDSSCVHLTFADKAGPTLQNVPFVDNVLLADTFLIESGIKKRFSTSFELPLDAKLRSVTPLAHLLCRSWEVFAVLPNKTSLPLLSIADWDFHWREKYVFEEVLELPKGTKIYATAIYDNTVENPYNPSDPPHTMKSGPHMFDESFKCYFEFAPTGSNDGRIAKPFVSTDQRVSELSFQISKSETATLTLHNITAKESTLLTSKRYKSGTHTLRTTSLPSAPGRYCISLQLGAEVIDTWWFVIGE